VHQWAFCTLTTSTWAREFYDRKIAAGKPHHSALRALANRWLEILWHCLAHSIRYDETIDIHNREQATQPPSAA
jgi:hypothetical protein